MITSKLGFMILFVKNPQISADFYSDLFNLKPIESSPTLLCLPFQMELC